MESRLTAFTDKQIAILRKELLALLRAWKSPTLPSLNLLPAFLVCRNYKKEGQVLTTSDKEKEVLKAALEDVNILNRELGEILELRFFKKIPTSELALKLDSSEDRIKKLQQQALMGLTQSIINKEKNVRRKQLAGLRQEIDTPSFSKLFGVEAQKKQLTEVLSKKGAPWIVGLTGIGGVGKTSLAVSGALTVVSKFIYEKVTWIRVNQSKLSAEDYTHIIVKTLYERFVLNNTQGEVTNHETMLKALDLFFAQQTCFVVIDNLELPKEVSYVLPLISRWANPSKFLVTSRSWPSEVFQTHHIPLDDLHSDDAYALFQEQVQIRGYVNIKNFSSQTFAKLYQLIGGNPLMIKLSVGLFDMFPNEEVFEDLRLGQNDKTEWTYKYIYIKLWHSLTEDAQQLLEAMPMVGRNGAKIPQISAMSRLNRKATLNSLSLLLNRSLLERKGDQDEKRYSIHSLTSTFIETEIIALPDAFMMDWEKYRE